MSESVCLQMSLSEKSDEELGSLLSQYGIKHGPIVGKYTHTGIAVLRREVFSTHADYPRERCSASET